MADFKFKIRNRKVTNDNNFYSVQITSSDSRIIVNSGTFGNCQNFTIGRFNRLISNFKLNIFDKIAEVKKLCFVSKPFLIVDLSRNSFLNIKPLLTVVTSINYRNANSSDMVLAIIDTRRKP